MGGALTKNIIGISRSLLRSSLEMTDSWQRHSDARSAEESRSWQTVPACSKNEMLHFVQHDIYLSLPRIWECSDVAISTLSPGRKRSTFVE